MTSSTFRFNFAINDDDEQECKHTGDAAKSPLSSSSPPPPPQQQQQQPIIEGEELFISEYRVNVTDMPFASLHHHHLNNSNSALMKYRVMDDDVLMPIVKDSRVRETLEHQSDITPRVYEGGFRLWECAIDVVEYIHEQDLHFDGQRVLDLGCGHGLPGISALLRGAKEVVLQDLNHDVLVHLSMPNVLANCTTSAAASRVRYVAGDWSSLKLRELIGTVDTVVTSDTLYSLASITVLVDVLDQVLRPNTGVAWVAAKRFYFGVGGGTLAFLEQIQQHPRLHACVVRTYEDGQSNIRELIKITTTTTTSSSSLS